MRRWILAMLICMLLLGCGGGNDPVNKGQDLPVHPTKKDKDRKTATS